MSFGDRLRELRLTNDLSMEKFGKIINASSSRISDWETGKNDPSSNFVVEISKKFGVSTDWLLKGGEREKHIYEKSETEDIFFNDKWESTYQSNNYDSFIATTAKLTEENIHLLNLMAEKLVMLDTYNNKYKTPSNTIEKRPSYKNKGLIIRDGTASYIPSEGFIKMPVVGKITAGDPVLAYENIEEHIAVPKSLIGSSTDVHFLLLVRGNSMINIGINEGDYVIARKQNSAENGEVVIAMTNDTEATVKTFYKENDYIRLQPENDVMKPILLKDVKILGKVVAVYRVSKE